MISDSEPILLSFVGIVGNVCVAGSITGSFSIDSETLSSTMISDSEPILLSFCGIMVGGLSKLGLDTLTESIP